MSGGQKLGSAGPFPSSWSSHDKSRKGLLLLKYGKRRIDGIHASEGARPIASVRKEEALLWRRGFDITVGNVCNTHVK